jgi:hypothetical protein
VITIARGSCCDPGTALCRTCGGRRGSPLLGVAFCAAALDAEQLYERLRFGKLPAEWPGTLEDARERMAITADGRPRLQVWLAKKYFETARSWWAKLTRPHRR